LRIFFECRSAWTEEESLRPSGCWDWLKLLLNEEMTPEMLRERDPRKADSTAAWRTLKNEQDVHLFERLLPQRREV